MFDCLLEVQYFYIPTLHNTYPPYYYFCSSDTSTPFGGAVNRAQVKNLGNTFLSLLILSAQPSRLGIGVLSSSISIAPPSS